MKKQFAFSMLSFFIMVANVAFAQEDGYNDFRAKMTSVFEYVNKDKVPTGILSDYGLLLVEPNGYDGIPRDTNYVDLTVWKQLYFGMYDSQINSKASLQEPQLVFDNLKARQSLAVMHLYYNKLDENAEKRGLLKLENEQIKEVPGAASPYIQKELFAVTPCKTYFDSSTVSFTFDRNCYMDNTGLTVTRMEVKFGDESGYVNAQWGSPVSHKFSIGGEKDIYFRMTFSNGKSLISRTRITVVVSKPLTRADGTAMEITSYDIPATSSHSGGTMQVIFCNEATKGKYIRPLIIAEEADISWLTSDGDGVNLKTLIKSNSEFSSIISNLSKIYDIIYIDNKNGLDDINRNAALFKDVIDRVNGNLFQVFGSTAADSTYVVGLGMGGLVARVALNMMETNGKQHRVRKLITINTPYKGLNIPVGLQAFIRHIESFKIGKSKLGDLAEKVDQMESLLNSKAMRQMLIYSLNSKLRYDDVEYQKFINSSNVTRTPLLCQTVAISGGSQSGKRLLSPECMLIDYHGGSSMIDNWFLNFVLLGRMDLKYDITSKMLPDRKNINIYEGRFYIRKKIIFWHFDISLSHKSVDANSNIYPIDGASGNYLSLKKMKENSSDLKEILKFDDFCFVPTTSALGLSNWQERLSSYLQITGENTMCDRYYFSGENNESTNLIAFKDFLISELTPKIVGPTKLYSDTEMFVDNMPDISLIKYTWNFKNHNLSVVSQKGARAFIRPLSFGGEDILSVTVSIPFIDISINVPPVNLSVEKLSIVGENYISGLKNEYKINRNVVCDTVIWRVSDGVIIDSRRSDNSVIAYTEDELKNPWIEAVLVVNNTENVIRKDLISKGLRGIELQCRDSWVGKNSRGEECKKYAFLVLMEPRDLPLERMDICWGNTAKSDRYTFNALSGAASLKTEGNVEMFGTCQKKYSKVTDIDSTKFIAVIDTAKRIIVGDSSRLHILDSLGLNFPISHRSATAQPEPEPYFPIDKDIIYSRWGERNNLVLVTMPIVKDGERVSGLLKCKVSDYLGHEYIETASIYTSRNGRLYSSSPNPVNSVLTIHRSTADEPTISTLSIAAPETLVATLYNDYGLVRSVTFDGSQPSVNMNVSDLAAGTYYLNIMKNGNVIDRQVIFIKH